MLGKKEDYQELAEQLIRYMKGMADDIDKGDTIWQLQKRLRSSAKEGEKKLAYLATPMEWKSEEMRKLEPAEEPENRGHGRGRGGSSEGMEF